METTVKFHASAEDSLFRYAVLFARYEEKWVFCKHKKRDTLECPGGHREPRENIYATAARELWEETGAEVYKLTPAGIYSATGNDGPIRDESETYGMLYLAEITEIGELPAESEMEKIVLLDKLPREIKWTYPAIQPILLRYVAEQFDIPVEWEEI